MARDPRQTALKLRALASRTSERTRSRARAGDVPGVHDAAPPLAEGPASALARRADGVLSGATTSG